MINNREIFKLLPGSVIDNIAKVGDINKIQEIRFRINKPLIFQLNKREYISDLIISKEQISGILQRISNYSIYAFEEDIKQGFITFNGGHRIGLCGECVVEDRRIKTIKNISSLNIRITKEFLGCSDSLLPHISKGNKILNTIVISPPKGGKTTILRDLTRNISNGLNIKGKKVSLMDERSEIAACSQGIPQMNIGIRTDVFDNCVKSQGIMMAIRSMSPEVIICDEIGTDGDVASIMMAYNCGVNLICSIHGERLEDYKERLVFRELVENSIFNRAVFLLDAENPGKITSVYNLDDDIEIMGGGYV